MNKETMHQLQEALGQGTVEQSYEGDWYLSIPAGGYQDAVEIDYDADEKVYYVTYRSWDATHGLNNEVEYGSYLDPTVAGVKAKEVLNQIEANYQALERTWEEYDKYEEQ